MKSTPLPQPDPTSGSPQTETHVGPECWCGNVDLYSFSPGYLVCPACQTLVSRQFPDANVARLAGREEGLYGRSYYLERLPQKYGFADLPTRARTELPERCLHWLRTLLRYKLPPGRILEVGSAHGGFVALLCQTGFDATGLELSPWLAEFATRSFGVPMLIGPVEDQTLAPASLDAIALMDVLEHLPVPGTTMARCFDLLKPDGILLIQTPRFPEAKTYDDMLADADPFVQHLKEEEHLYLFSREAIREFFHRLGAPHVAFEPAIFGHYDMFLAVSREPFATHAPAEIEVALTRGAGPRIAQALVDLETQLSTTRHRAHEAESSRLRLEERLHQLEERGQQLEAELHRVEAELHELERDRAAGRATIEAREAEISRLHAEMHRRIEDGKGLLERVLAAEIEANAFYNRLTQLAALVDARERIVEDVTRTLRGARAYRLLRALGRWDVMEQGLAKLAGEGGTLRQTADAALQIPRKLTPEYVADFVRQHVDRPELFHVYESYQLHLTPVSFYSPIPQVGALGEELWESPSALPGIELNETVQLTHLDTVFPPFKAEYDAFPTEPGEVPHEYHFNQMMFRTVDAEVLYCMVRHYRPCRMVEVGSGYSTYVAAAAVRKNAAEGHPVDFTAIEPYPNEVLRQGVPGVSRLLAQPVQTVDKQLFADLDANDILFIDSSHVVRIDSDVRMLVLEVLPRLRPGVLVHLHDIFLPFEYPREWVVKEHRFWAEQYLLQAFLAFNTAFEVIWAGNHMHHRHSEKLRRVFSQYEPEQTSPGSFWLRRVR